MGCPLLSLNSIFLHNFQKTGLFSEIQEVIQKVLRLLKNFYKEWVKKIPDQINSLKFKTFPCAPRKFPFYCLPAWLCCAILIRGSTGSCAVGLFQQEDVYQGLIQDPLVALNAGRHLFNYHPSFLLFLLLFIWRLVRGLI